MFFFLLLFLFYTVLCVVLPNVLFPHCSPSQCRFAGTQGDGLLSYWGAEHSTLCLFLLDGALQGNQEGISLIQWACCISQHIVPMNRVNTHTLYSNAPSIPLCPSATLSSSVSLILSQYTCLFSNHLHSFSLFLKLNSNTIEWRENNPVSDCSLVLSKWTGVLVAFDLYRCPLCHLRIQNVNQHLKKMQTLRKNVLFGTSGKF